MIINILNKMQLRFYVAKLQRRVGVCSQQYKKQDKHMLLWDFDNVSLDEIINALKKVQQNYYLPSIFVIKSSLVSYHAYCFTARTFQETINILSATPTIDMAYLKLGIVRGYFTLRITPRVDEPDFKLVNTLTSGFINEMSPDAMTINEYFTSNIGEKHNVKE